MAHTKQNQTIRRKDLMYFTQPLQCFYMRTLLVSCLVYYQASCHHSTCRQLLKLLQTTS